ncbi:unnamed protein product, partial [Notodromas monacha]
MEERSGRDFYAKMWALPCGAKEKEQSVVVHDPCHGGGVAELTSFREASRLLYAATWRLASFKTIVVSLPPTWDARSCGVGAHEEGRVVNGGEVDGVDASFRLQGDDAAKQAAFVVDVQLGGGHLTPYTVQPVARRLIVKEWAKLKYGVFDETHRSASDPSSPSYYTPFGISGPEEPVPTRCSNIPVKGHRNCVGPTCHFLPLDKVAENDGVVSSLMSYPDLPQVTQFCNETTHDPEVPTKHNLLCDGLSTGQVIRENLDFLG